MRILSASIVGSILLGLFSCSENEESALIPEQSSSPAIEVNTSTADFVTRADDGSMDSLRSVGFRVWALYTEQLAQHEFGVMFDDTVRYNEGWKFGSTHIWPDTTTQLTFYALSPGFFYPEEEIEDRFYFDQDSLFVDVIDYYSYGYYDIMLAKKEAVSFQSNEYKSCVTLPFEHIKSKVSLKFAFKDQIENPYPEYMVDLYLYGDKSFTFNVDAMKWKTTTQLPDDFNIESAGDFNDYAVTIGDSRYAIEATPEGEEWIYSDAGYGFVIPQKYQVVCHVAGIEEDGQATLCASRSFDLDLTGKRGVNTIVKVSMSISGEGYIPTLSFELSDEELTEMD